MPNATGHTCPVTNPMVPPSAASYCQEEVPHDLASGLRSMFYSQLADGWTIAQMRESFREFAGRLHREQRVPADRIAREYEAFVSRVLPIDQPLARKLAAEGQLDRTTAGPAADLLPYPVEKALLEYVDPHGARENLLLLGQLVSRKGVKLRPRPRITLPKSAADAMVVLMTEWSALPAEARSVRGEVFDPCLLRHFFTVRSTSEEAAQAAKDWLEEKQKGKTTGLPPWPEMGYDEATIRVAIQELAAKGMIAPLDPDSAVYRNILSLLLKASAPEAQAFLAMLSSAYSRGVSGQHADPLTTASR